MHGKMLKAAIGAAIALGLAAPGFIHLSRAQVSAGTGFAMSHDHVGISVPDLDESVAWYRDMLGFEEVLRFEEARVPMTIAHIRRGDIYIELFEVPGAADLPDHRRDPTEDLRTRGVKHFGLHVENLKDVLRTLKARGVEVAMPLRESDRTAFVFVRDNAGNSLELIERKAR